ncbi:MAG: hypothetical protein U0625_04805 [Phycisphaerales bacterium]
MQTRLPISSSTLCAIAAAATLAAAPAFGGIVTDNPNGFALRSGGAMTLASQTEVAGSVGVAGALSRGWQSTVSGTVISNSVTGWNSPSFGSFTSGGSNVYLDWNQSRTLSAGSYGAFTSNSSTTLNLSAGTYAFSSFQLGWAGSVVANTSAGDVYVLVSGALNAGDQTQFRTVGSGRLYLVSTGSASFGYHSEITAAVYSAASMSFGSETALHGIAYAGGSLTTGYASHFEYSASPVPGPASLALIGAAGIFGGRRRRR